MSLTKQISVASLLLVFPITRSPDHGDHPISESKRRQSAAISCSGIQIVNHPAFSDHPITRSPK
jgi:hypothetical protein